METFLYKAKSSVNGKKISGELQAENELAVREMLMKKNLDPLSISKKSTFNADLSEVGIFKQKIKLTDINFFCKQFASMIQAGISIGKGLNICAQQCSNKTLKKHLEHIHSQVTEGKTLSEATREENIFPDILVSMIECGEASGNLDKVLQQTVDHFDNQLGVTKKVKKALAYPTIVLVIVAVVVVILMVKVIPNFMGLLTETGAEIPIPTQIVIAVSNFCIAKWPILIGIVVVLVVIGFNIKKIPSCRRALDRLSLKLPIFGDLNKKSISAVFASTMSMLVESGIPMLQAIEITKKVIGNAVADEELDLAIISLKQGQSLYDSLSGSIIYPPIMYSMINIGEETGALDDMLIKISVYFKEEVDIAVDNMTLLIEPALTIFMAVIVGGIMLAVMLPTFAAANAMM
ncbi:type II secretion system F family protein [Cellulosilyticum lentocellum]|uniref:Type II secretion system F domain n=1 Tax=Cellulosilyticum lentocellum (strain ATCC 49066 / DSM 5427 / NCIMB 11756 / RHM5) TaxID=642492 RepID=F2JMC4_CELLD|nr:type II secretion system F family protein [Cellulosilyticum lentocellum]ADZ83442.1 Type II secretion system F domain [Cellulosilyticum lentocellum DSM 5427]